MLRKDKLNTSFYLLLYLLLTTLVAGILSSYLNYFYTINYIETEIDENAEILLANLSKELAEPLWNLDREAVERITGNYIYSADIKSIEVLNDFDELMYSLSLSETGSSSSEYTIPIIFNDRNTGRIIFRISLERVNIARQSIIRTIIVVMSAVIISIISVTVVSVRKFVVRPLDRLVSGLTHIGAGNYKYTLQLSGQYDIDNIIRSVNDMAAQIDSRTDMLKKEVSERILAEKQARESEKNLYLTLNSIGDGVIVTDMEGRVTMLNPAAEKMTGWTGPDAAGEKLEKVFTIVDSESLVPSENPAEIIFEEKEVINLPPNIMLISKNGVNWHIADSGAPIRGDSGDITGSILVFRDISTEYQLEAQLRQSRKMDLIGQLAGGIAHDFNNMLCAIKGYNSLLLDSLEKESDFFSYAKEIDSAIENANELTGMLLSFSRQKKKVYEDLDLHRLIHETVRLFSRSTPAALSVSEKLDAEFSIIKGDVSQLQSVFLNLLINAKDAMNDTGEIRISSENINISKAESVKEFIDIDAGKYICVTVSDSGCGINMKIIDKIFEPFFTTKPEGKGTGLGLATVYGTLKNHKGAIDVNSVVGKGTDFYIYLKLSSREL